MQRGLMQNQRKLLTWLYHQLRFCVALTLSKLQFSLYHRNYHISITGILSVKTLNVVSKNRSLQHLLFLKKKKQKTERKLIQQKAETQPERPVKQDSTTNNLMQPSFADYSKVYQWVSVFSFYIYLEEPCSNDFVLGIQYVILLCLAHLGNYNNEL